MFGGSWVVLFIGSAKPNLAPIGEFAARTPAHARARCRSIRRLSLQEAPCCGAASSVQSHPRLSCRAAPSPGTAAHRRISSEKCSPRLSPRSFKVSIMLCIDFTSTHSPDWRFSPSVGVGSLLPRAYTPKNIRRILNQNNQIPMLRAICRAVKLPARSPLKYLLHFSDRKRGWVAFDNSLAWQ